jgi:hypothetical protein
MIPSPKIDSGKRCAKYFLRSRKSVGASVSAATFSLNLGADAKPAPVRIEQLVIAGWTGRDKRAVEEHIRELEALGVKRPLSTPIFYRVAVSRLTLASSIQAIGTRSSGEVEVVLLRSAGRLWVGVGSDHTDREVESYGVTVSKQMCDKPIAAQFWAFDDLESHWDLLQLRSRIEENGEQVVYQDGTAAAFLQPRELIRGYARSDTLADNTLMFCGTLAARGGVRAAERFDFELEDPVLKRKIQHHYRIVPLPIAG